MGLRLIIRVVLGVMTVLVLANLASVWRAPAANVGQAAFGSASQCGR